MVAYSATTDLLTGDVPLPDYLNPQKFVDDAADEIDSKIGFIYQTPVNIADTVGNPVVRPVRLLLKRLNNFLASGRLLLAVATPDENERVHAYGLYLVQEATNTLNAIASGELPLTGAAVLEPDGETTITAPLQYNKDEESNVDAFYDRIANPDYFYLNLGPSGFVR